MDPYWSEVLPYLPQAQRSWAPVFQAVKEKEITPAQVIEIQKQMALYRTAGKDTRRALFLAVALSALQKGAEPLSIFDTAKTAEEKALLDLYLRTTNAVQARSLLGMLYTRAHWHHEGRKYYEVSAGLAHALRHTELRGMVGSDVKLPFASMYIEVPRMDHFEVDVPGAGPVIIGGIYLHESPAKGNQRQLSVMVHTLKNEGALSFILSFQDNEKLTDVIKKLQQAHAKEQKDMAGMDLYDENLFDHETWPRVVHWVLNLLMYLTCREVESVYGATNKEFKDLTARLPKATGATRESIKARLKSTDPDYRYKVGASVKKSVIDEAIERREGKPLEVRTKVKAHWHHIVHGPGRALRERRWMREYWKGNPDAPESNPIRLVIDNRTTTSSSQEAVVTSSTPPPQESNAQAQTTQTAKD